MVQEHIWEDPLRRRGSPRAAFSGDQEASEGSTVGALCLFAPVACWLELVLACLPAVTKMDQVGVGEALAACKPGRVAISPEVATLPMAWWLSLLTEQQLGSKLNPWPGRLEPKLGPFWQEEDELVCWLGLLQSCSTPPPRSISSEIASPFLGQVFGHPKFWLGSEELFLLWAAADLWIVLALQNSLQTSEFGFPRYELP